MFDLKVIHSVLDQMEEERGVPRDKMLEAIELALATAYKKEYGKKGQIIRARFNNDTGTVEFYQVKIVVDESSVIMPDADAETGETSFPAQNVADEDTLKVRYNPEHHILIADAQRIKKDAKIDDEIVFPLEKKENFGRIAAQTAKQVIIQKIREAEKVSVLSEYGKKEGEIVSGIVQRTERGALFIDMGKAIGIIPYEEQIPGERFKQGERIRAYLISVEETPRGVTLRLSRAHPQFVSLLFKTEAPEVASGTVEIKSIAREAGQRTKVAAASKDPHIDPIGSLVGQRGVRVATVISELGGEKIDVVEWSEDPATYVGEAIKPARAISIVINNAEHRATVEVSADQQSLAIGRGGQNVRLAAKLTGWNIDIIGTDGATVPVSPEESGEKSQKKA
jgi:N utilization substance protein A